MSKKFKAAVYVRLSKEDGDVSDSRKVESNSISNQKSMILRFLEDKKDIEVYSVYEDDGYSGSTFDRPAFQLMMQDIMNEKVNCIIVKDLSRFGREYIGSGRYIERLFPSMGIRFIAINDNYDSMALNDSANEIVIPFKNLINDAYCRDISIKIRSHLEVKRQNGDYVGNFCVYGYKKSDTAHSRLIPDEYAGHVVQDIFAWIKTGMSLDAISKKLNAQGIQSPFEYKQSNGEKLNCSFKKSNCALWSPVAVRRIATNPIYIGTLIQGKVTTPNHKIKIPVTKNADKWAVIENNHEPLISKRDFDIVQRLLSIDMRTAPGNKGIYLLSGIAVCADCGSLMTRKVCSSGGRKYAYYVCSANKKKKICSPHRIREEILEKQVRETVTTLIEQLLWADEVIQKAGEKRNNVIDRKKRKERLDANEAEISKYNELLASLYEDYKEGIVDKDDFIVIKSGFERKRKDAGDAITRINEEERGEQRRKEREKSLIEEFRKYNNISELSRNIVVNILHSVRVFEGGKLEVILDCDDEMRILLEKAKDLSDPKSGDKRNIGREAG